MGLTTLELPMATESFQIGLCALSSLSVVLVTVAAALEPATSTSGHDHSPELAVAQHRVEDRNIPGQQAGDLFLVV